MIPPYYEDSGLRLFHGSNKDILPSIPDGFYDSIVTDPPYEIGFMGKGWDSSGIAYDVDLWRGCLRVLKPGGHLLAFGGTRTWHRMAVAVEDAGFEIRDSIAWLYGSGFPKSLDVSKAIDKAAGSGFGGQVAGRTDATWVCDACGKSRGSQPGNCQCDLMGKPVTPQAAEWQGWGTALKPAFEPIVVARKPLAGTVAANVLEHGTGALNIDACRVPYSADDPTLAWGVKYGGGKQRSDGQDYTTGMFGDGIGNVTGTVDSKGRFPANVLLDESQAAVLDAQSGVLTSGKPLAGTKPKGDRRTFGQDAARGYETTRDTPGDSGGASRFFPIFRYEAKAPQSERPEVDGMVHATVKPLDLMRWLVRLVTRPGGRVLDPFAGSGTTGEAALLESMQVDLIELEEAYLPLILQRVHKPLQPTMFGNWEGNAA